MVIFLLYIAADVFLFIVGGHLLTNYMALQTFRSMSIMVCTSQLAFMRCPPSILKKYHVAIFLNFSPLTFLFVKKS